MTGFEELLGKCVSDGYTQGARRQIAITPIKELSSTKQVGICRHSILSEPNIPRGKKLKTLLSVISVSLYEKLRDFTDVPEKSSSQFLKRSITTTFHTTLIFHWIQSLLLSCIIKERFAKTSGYCFVEKYLFRECDGMCFRKK